jgi:hypothetical protein
MRPPISKITNAKWTRDLAQVVQHLLYKCKALSSNPYPTKKKRLDLLNAISKRVTVTHKNGYYMLQVFILI